MNHSFSIVNQHQILELLKLPRLALYHKNVQTEWNRTQNNGEFPAFQQESIDRLPPAQDEIIDCIYRISSPIIAGSDQDYRKTITFIVTEFGLSNEAFADRSCQRSFFTREQNVIVTPTRWSHDRLSEYGFPTERIHVIPHGVDCSIYFPLSAQERIDNRSNLGICEDETVFFNIGAPLWHKGLDLLLISFAHLRNTGLRIRLILKDQRGLYGRSIEDAIRKVGKAYPPLLQENVINSILLITSNLTQNQLRLYYGITDCYVSPYRAEGFNLPVLEAIACGTPTIVTDGGATDDFCLDGLSLRIPALARSGTFSEDGSVVRYLEPNLDGLIDAMRSFRPVYRDTATIRRQILDKFDWGKASQHLADLILPCASERSAILL